MRIENDIKVNFSDVMIRPKRSTLNSRQEVSLLREYTFKHTGKKYSGTPIIGANMDGVGSFTMAKALLPHNLSVALRKGYTGAELIKFLNASPEHLKQWLTIGITEKDLERLKNIVENVPNLTLLCIDVANGYTEAFVNAVKKIRKAHPHLVIMAGNVVTGDMTEELILAGADIVKVGIANGSACKTMMVTGVSYPQLSAVIECADAAHGLGGFICSDGGCRLPGDINKAFGAGADFVMIGGMLAGYYEGEYDLEHDEHDKPFYTFYGMSSVTAQEKYEDGKMRPYRASEGATFKISPKGYVEAQVLEILGGLRSCCTYVGARSLKELSKRTTFIRVTQQHTPMF